MKVCMAKRTKATIVVNLTVLREQREHFQNQTMCIEKDTSSNHQVNLMLLHPVNIQNETTHVLND